MAQACALLSERHLLEPRTASTSSDLLSALDQWTSIPAHVQRVAREVEGLVAESPAASGFSRTRRLPDADFRKAVLAGYPDRVAQRREPQSPRVLLSTGAGAVVAPQSGVTDGAFLVALDVQASTRPNDPDARVRLASIVDRDWLQPTGVDVVHRFDATRGAVKAVAVERYDALTLSEQPVEADPETRAALFADAWMKRGARDADEQLLRRLRFAGVVADVSDLVRRAALTARSLDDVDLAAALAYDERRTLDHDAPETIQVPSGRTATLEYEADGTVSASVKLQELFGLADTPVVGPRKEPVRLALLAPNGRPVQTTRDLRSFWNTTYAEVRKELRGRYPRHPWPEDPWTATPTARTTKRKT
jgi:ATP-dependent helicase HrpB